LRFPTGRKSPTSDLKFGSPDERSRRTEKEMARTSADEPEDDTNADGFKELSHTQRRLNDPTLAAPAGFCASSAPALGRPSQDHR